MLILILNYGGPHLIEIPPHYGAASSKLMVVGQQAYEWGKYSVAELTHLITLYREFLQGTSKYPSPFWHFSREVNKGINSDCSGTSFVWTNIFKIDRNNRRPGKAIEQQLIQMGLLEKEIEICAPDVVLFLTGPDYDEYLKIMFPGVKFDAMSKHFLHRVVHEKLPNNCFRTYHPRYLRVKAWENEIRQAIITSV